MADRPLPESFEDKIREYIVTHYQDDPSKFNEAFKEIATMRNTIMRGSVDVESVCVMKRYYGQLVGIKKRFPMEEGDPLAVPFSWADRALDLPTSLVYEDIDFELCCIMFNIGAAHALIAANESRNDLDSIKNSFMHFQCAAYPIQYLRDQMGCGKYSALDFEPSFLTFYLNVMLAQAQECLLEKSMIDQRKPLVIAKVAFYLRDVYKQCVYHLDNSGISELVSTSKFRTFVRLCSTKSELYAAIGNFYLGHKAEDEKNMGLRLSYFAQALIQIKSACKIAAKEQKGTLKEAVQFAYDVIFQREANARRENDFIYHERVTKPEDLEKLEGVVMVKPIAFDPFDPSIAGEDLFKSLLPTDVIKAISIYAEEKARFKREIYADVEAKDNQLDNYLISLQLDQLHLNEPIDQMRLPDELLQSSAAFSAQPDSFPDLLKKFDKVMSTANEAENKLSDLRRRLSQVEDAKLKQDEGFQAINAKLEELTSHHVKAKSNNIELQRAMASHSENLKLLAMPLAELSRQICGQFIDPSVTTEGSTLRKMLDKVDEMRKQRCKLMSALNEDLENDDIARKALAERDLDPKKLFEKELDKHSKTINMIQQNMTAQETILKALTEANANFAEFRRQIMESNEQKALQSLTIVTAFQVFMDVTDKTDQALNFYTQLFSFISALSKGVEHIEAAKLNKKLEAERVENEKRAAREAAETMRDFSLGSVQPHARTVQPEIGDISSGPPPPSSAPQGTRPRRGDYMSYYRNKMAPASPAVSTPLDPPNKQPQVQVPYSNQQAYGASQMHAPNHPAGHYLPNSTYSNPGVSQFTANCSNLQPMRPYPPSSTPNNQLINTNPSNYNPSNDITYQAQISTQISAPNATHHSQQYTYQSGQQAGYPIQQPISQHSDKTYQQSGQQILPSQPTQTPAILPQTYYQYANQTPQNSRIHQYSSIPVSASSKPSEQQHQQPPQIHHLNQQYAPTSYTPSPAAPMGTLASARHQQAYQPTASMDPGSSQTIASIASMPASFALAVQQPKTNSAQPTYTHPAVPRPAGPAAQHSNTLLLLWLLLLKSCLSQ
uniref:BRO1 domain-containing protein n=1 Tax=Ditylenchus dipsaci TaxID=166011 RepID=A0A915DP80_9BILA